MDIEWNQLKIREFSSDSAKASGCRSTPTVGPRALFGQWFQKLVEPGKAYCAVYRTELCYSDRGAVVFTRHANSEAHQQKLQAESSDSTLPWVEWCLLIRVIICWTHPLHQRLFTGQLMAVLSSATWGPTIAHVNLTAVKSCFETILLQILQAQHFQEAFFIIDKLFLTFGGRTVISALIVW